MGKTSKVALAIWAAFVIVGSGFECWGDHPKRVQYLTGVAYLVALAIIWLWNRNRQNAKRP